MRSGDIIITSFDRERLAEIIEKYKAANKMIPAITQLEGELARANIVSQYDIPGDIVTLNSKVRFRITSTGEERVYTLVFPHKADIDGGMLSILSPVGISLLGYRVGDMVEWEVPDGTIEIEILEVVYQPESAGDYHL